MIPLVANKRVAYHHHVLLDVIIELFSSLNVLFMQSPIDMQQDIMQYSDSALICCQLLEIILA